MIPPSKEMKSGKILVVEDESDVRELMLLHLRRHGYEAIGIDNGEDAHPHLESGSFDLAVLDWMLPGQSGLQLCKRWAGKLPLLMVTARADTADVIIGLEMGADDYLIKPFEIGIFLARVRTLLRRTRGAVGTDCMRIGELEVDPAGYGVTLHGVPLKLTPSEFKLLLALMKNRGRVLSRQQLIEEVQGEGVMVIDRAIDTHVFGLRKKLGDGGDWIETVRGVGYRIKL